MPELEESETPGLDLNATAAAIRAAREALGISGSELARRAGVTQAYISKIEAAQATPSGEVLDRVLAALGISPTELAADVALNEELARALALAMGVREQTVRRLIALPDPDMKRGLLSLVERLLDEKGE